MSRRATAQDVANLAGVSRSAVSLVLNGRAQGNISLAKQQAVREAASRLAYRRNVVAQGLRMSKTRVLGVLTWRGGGGLPLHLIASALQTALDADYMLIKMYAEPTETDQLRALATLGDRQVDGLLIVSPELCEYPAVDALSEHPVVLLNCLDPTRQLTSVIPDEHGAGAQAAELLFDQGHRDIGLLSGPLEHYQTAQRARGVERATAAAGASLAAVHTTPTVRIDAGYTAATALLTQHARPTALICTNERFAVGALLAAAQLGLRVPDDLSLVCLDDREQLTAQLHPPITQVERPDDRMASHAADLLIKAVEVRGAQTAQQYSFLCHVAAGASIAPPA